MNCSMERCPNVYHFPCAVNSGCKFGTKSGKQVFCFDHISRKNKSLRSLSSNENRRIMYILEDPIILPSGVVIPPTISGSKINELIIRVGSLSVHSLGQISPFSHFHSESVLYPLYYTATRIYWSYKKTGVRIVYTCEVLANLEVNVPPGRAKALHKEIRDSDAVMEERLNQDEDIEKEMEIKPCFRITPEDDCDHPIIANTAEGILYI